MDKEVLGTIHNVEIFPVIALAIFFIFFAIMLVRVMRSDRNEERMLASIPLNDGVKDNFIDNPFQEPLI